MRKYGENFGMLTAIKHNFKKSPFYYNDGACITGLASSGT